MISRDYNDNSSFKGVSKIIEISIVYETEATSPIISSIFLTISDKLEK